MTKRRTRKTNARRGNRVILYIRVSDTTGREETLVSPDVQLAEGKAACAREGLVIVRTVIELDKSGRTSDKRQIATIINDIEAGEADGVLVWKVSRWGRNTRDSLLNINELQLAGGFIVSATENLTEIDTPAGKLHLTVLLAIAQMFSDEIGSTWESIHDYRISLGKTASKTWRMGYLREQDIAVEERAEYEFPAGVDYILDPQTSPWIRKAFEWHHTGVSFLKVVQRLNEAGVRSYNGAELTHSTLRRTLDGGFQAGYIVDRRGDEEIFHPGKHEAITTPELFKAYRAKIALNVPARNKNAQYKATRLIDCASCGHAMRPKLRRSPATGEYVLHWRCSLGEPNTNSRTKCERPAYAVNSLVEQSLWHWLTSIASGQSAIDTHIARARKAKQAQKDVARIEQDLTKQHRLLSRLADKNMEGTFDDALFKVKQTEIREVIARLEANRDLAAGEQTVNEVPDTTVFGGLMEGWDSVPPEVFNQALSQVVGRIRIHRAETYRGKATIEIVPRWELDAA